MAGRLKVSNCRSWPRRISRTKKTGKRCFVRLKSSSARRCDFCLIGSNSSKFEPILSGGESCKQLVASAASPEERLRGREKGSEGIVKPTLHDSHKCLLR